jgi:hypothetical protein
VDAPTIRGELRDHLNVYGIQVTETALNILSLSIFAIVSDTEPTWSTPAIPLPNLDDVQRHVIAGVALRLSLLARSRRGIQLSEPIRSFPILHNISRWIDNLCPFDKPRQQAIQT